MSESPFFSVLVPTYNQAQYLGSALDSLLAQTDPDWEAIIVNDGSTDSTREVIDAYCRKDSRFRAFHKENGGVASALNVGLREARGQWICWLSSDDLFEPKKLEIHRQWIAKYPVCRFFFTHFNYFDDATKRLTYPWTRKIPGNQWQILEMLQYNYIHGNSICVHRKTWSQAGYFDEKLRYGQDYDMWLRLLARNYAIFIPERTCITRIHPSQSTRGFPQAPMFDCSKSGISFLNQHEFSELVPLVNLSDSKLARKACAKALSIAANRSGYLYGLGSHSALLFRIMEWAWNDCPKEIAPSIQNIVRERASEVECQYSGTVFGFFWKCAAAVSRLTHSRFDYQQVAPAEVAEANYHTLKHTDIQGAEQLHRYLEEFEKYSLPSDLTHQKGKVQEIVIVDREIPESRHQVSTDTTYSISRLAIDLTKSGRRIVYISLSKQPMSFSNGVLFIGADSSESFEKILKLLSPIDLLIDMSPNSMPFTRYSSRYLTLPREARQPDPVFISSCAYSSEATTDWIAAIESVPVRISRLQIIIFQIWRHGQIRGTIHRIQHRVSKVRIVTATVIVWRTLIGAPFIIWPSLLKNLLVESHQKHTAQRLHSECKLNS